MKLHLVLSAFREHRGGADPQRGKPAHAHTYASQALPVDVDRNPGETSLSSATVLLPSPKSIFKNVKCCHSTNGEAEVLKDVSEVAAADGQRCSLEPQDATLATRAVTH